MKFNFIMYLSKIIIVRVKRLPLRFHLMNSCCFVLYHVRSCGKHVDRGWDGMMYMYCFRSLKLKIKQWHSLFVSFFPFLCFCEVWILHHSHLPSHPIPTPKKKSSPRCFFLFEAVPFIFVLFCWVWLRYVLIIYFRINFIRNWKTDKIVNYFFILL